MGWSRFDDALESHRKRRRAGHEAFGVWTAAVLYCNRYKTDGYVDVEWMVEELPKKPKRASVVNRLIKVGFLEALPAGDVVSLQDRSKNDIKLGPFSDEGWIVHDFFDRNFSSIELDDRREKERLKKADQRSVSPRDNGGTSGGTPLGTGLGTPSGPRARPRPVPIPVPKERGA